MIQDSKILEAFKDLLGDQYVILPKDKEELVKHAQEILGDQYEIVPKNDDDRDFNDNTDAENETETDNEIKIGSAPGPEPESDLDKEALALFQRDQENSEYIRRRGTDEKPVSKIAGNKLKETKEVAEVQEIYRRTQKQIKSEIKELEKSIKHARAGRKELIQNEDKDNPFLSQMLTSYDIDEINNRIDRLKRIKNDPFYGRYLFEKDNGERIDVFIGLQDFQNEDVQIISTFCPVGKAFRGNVSTFRVNNTMCKVLRKYTYAKDNSNNKIIGVKDESPR